MKKITPLSDDAKQSMSVATDDGQKVSLTLEYVQANQGWFISIGYGTTFLISKRRLVTSPNILRAFKGIIPFGIACVTTDKQEPVYKSDFASGRASLYLLTPSDVAYVEGAVIPAYA